MKHDLTVFFCGDLNPVASKAQKKVPLPEGLDLDAWINEPIQSESESSEDDMKMDSEVFVKSSAADISSPKHRSIEPSPKEMQKTREARLLQRQQDPNYLKPKLGTPIKTFKEEDVPIRPLEFSGVSPLLIPGLATTEQYFDLNNSVDEKRSDRRGKKKKHKEKSKKRSKHIEENGILPNDRENSNELPVFVNRAAEMPDGANETDGDEEEDRKTGDEDDPHR